MFYNAIVGTKTAKIESENTHMIFKIFYPPVYTYIHVINIYVSLYHSLH